MRPDARLIWKTRIFALIVILSNPLGDLALKLGMQNRLTTTPLQYVAAIFSPWVMVGISLLIVWLLARMLLLSWADLSYVLPVTSLGYVLNAVVGRFYLNEQITAHRWWGTVLIVAGTVLVGIGSPNTEHDS